MTSEIQNGLEKALPFVSVIIPCRNEEKFIGKCLESIIKFDYPRDRLEIIVADGMSTDATRHIVMEFKKRYEFIRFLENPQKIVSSALNLAIKTAIGEIIIRLDAHSYYQGDYISKCVGYLEKYKVENVGGQFKTVPGKDTLIANSIALAMSNPFGVGNAHYRLNLKNIRHVDTVPYGCFRRSIFDKVGFFDEDLVRNQDDEFNFRIIKNGGKILLAPDIVITYHARDTIGKLWRMYFQYGYFKVLAAKKLGAVNTWRQLAPAAFVLSMFLSAALSYALRDSVFFLGLMILYLLANLGATLITAAREGWWHLFTLPPVFAAIHISYGLGYLKGIFDFIFLKKNKNKKIYDVPLTR
jgi:glycosyltransferase involved in cell wall biosynthesis